MRTSGYMWGLLLMIGTSSPAFAEESIRSAGTDPRTGSSLAVVVPHRGLVHTAQLLPVDEQGEILAEADTAAQAERVCLQLVRAVEAAAGPAATIVKLNVYLAELDGRPAVEEVLARRFPKDPKPAVSYVVTRLPHAACQVAMDAVAATVAIENQVLYQQLGGGRGSVSSLTPPGSMIYVAGQAEKGTSLADATVRTLESLQKTLQHLDRDLQDVVQIKSFLSPMSNVEEAHRALIAFFGDRPVPPVVWVEWTTPLIEIEVIAWGGKRKPDGPTVEFITPPGMTASPVYSRVARTHADRLIYVSGLYSRQPADAAGEVTDIFTQLDALLQNSGSSLQHLVKATYYCSNNDTSAKLNELRPQYYNPARPPSASKALVRGVGHTDRGLTIDMIAVPRD